MPVKPENKKLYPHEWRTKIRPRIRARAGDKCEFCGVQNHAIGYRDHTGTFHDENKTGWRDHFRFFTPKKLRIVCTVMHLNHDPTDNRDENLKLGCQKCHNSYDAKHRAETRAKTLLKKQAPLVKKQNVKLGESVCKHGESTSVICGDCKNEK